MVKTYPLRVVQFFPHICDITLVKIRDDFCPTVNMVWFHCVRKLQNDRIV